MARCSIASISAETSTTTLATTAITTRVTTVQTRQQRDRRQDLAAVAAITLLLWPLVAFGGTAPSTAIPFGLVSLLYAIVVAPRVESALDRALLLVVAAVLVQLIPQHAVVSALISPHAARVRSDLALAPVPQAAWHPLTIEVAATAWAAIELLGAVALFFAVRERFGQYGVRRTIRAVAAIGFGLSLLAVAQAATAGRSIYWRFPTEFDGPLPFGPFVNRNHCAAWIIMAIPLCVGYLAAHLAARQRAVRPVSTRARILELSDGRTLWLTVSITAMLIAALLSLSRSAAAGLGVSALITLFTVRRALYGRPLRTLVVSTALLMVFAISWADLGAIRERIAGTPAGMANRLTIWRETVPLVRDFAASGAGAGTYEIAMRAYQRSDRRVYFNQAHSHYLQLAAEGGLLVAVPVLLAGVLFVRTARERFAGDMSVMRWVRIGAACGLGAIAVQSAWETALTMSANAALAGVLAAIVVHRRDLSDNPWS